MSEFLWGVKRNVGVVGNATQLPDFRSGTAVRPWPILRTTNEPLEERDLIRVGDYGSFARFTHQKGFQNAAHFRDERKIFADLLVDLNCDGNSCRRVGGIERNILPPSILKNTKVLKFEARLLNDHYSKTRGSERARGAPERELSVLQTVQGVSGQRNR